MKEENVEKVVDEIVEKNRWRRAPVLPVLHGIYDYYGYLPEEALECAARKLGVSKASIYSAATFYHLFSLKPQGKYVIRVCDTFVCHMKESREIIEAIKKHLGIDVGGTTDDGLFTLTTVPCLGECDRAPAMMINDEIYVSLTPQKAVEIIEKYRREGSGK